MARKKNPFNAKNVAKELSKEENETFLEDEFEEDEVWGEDVFKLERGNSNGFVVFESEDSAYDAAIEYVKDMLENEPELFKKSWLMQHIDEKKLKEWVHDAESENTHLDDLAEEDPADFWAQAESWGLDVPEDEDTEPTEDEIEELKEEIAKDRAKHPMEYLRDLYGEDAMKKAMEVAGIDIKAAAEDAVDSDGWAHFLSGYDGNYVETDSGFVYYRE